MPDWNSRLVGVRRRQTSVTPIESFTPTYTTPVTPIHSIEADNVGAIYHPQTATFTMTVKAIGASVATLAKMTVEGTKFNVQLAESERLRLVVQKAAVSQTASSPLQIRVTQ